RRARRAVAAVDRRRRAPADLPIADLGQHYVVGGAAIVDAHQRAALETARDVDLRLARPDLQVGGEQRLGAGVLREAHPDVVAPAPLGARAHAHGWLVPGVLDHPL